MGEQGGNLQLVGYVAVVRPPMERAVGVYERVAFHPLAGSGNGDSTVTVFGMLAGAAAAHNFGLAGTADSTNAAGEFVRGGLSNTGKIAVVSGIVVCLAVSVLNLPKFVKKQEAK